jgi:hypothetical protein
MNFLVFGIVLIIAAFGSSADAHAQTGKAQIEKSCTNAKSAPRSRIAQCTAYIESIKVDLKSRHAPSRDSAGRQAPSVGAEPAPTERMRTSPGHSSPAPSRTPIRATLLMRLRT